LNPSADRNEIAKGVCICLSIHDRIAPFRVRCLRHVLAASFQSILIRLGFCLTFSSALACFASWIRRIPSSARSRRSFRFSVASAPPSVFRRPCWIPIAATLGRRVLLAGTPRPQARCSAFNAERAVCRSLRLSHQIGIPARSLADVSRDCIGNLPCREMSDRIRAQADRGNATSFPAPRHLPLKARGGPCFQTAPICRRDRARACLDTLPNGRPRDSPSATAIAPAAEAFTQAARTIDQLRRHDHQARRPSGSRHRAKLPKRPLGQAQPSKRRHRLPPTYLTPKPRPHREIGRKRIEVRPDRRSWHACAPSRKLL